MRAAGAVVPRRRFFTGTPVHPDRIFQSRHEHPRYPPTITLIVRTFGGDSEVTSKTNVSWAPSAVETVSPGAARSGAAEVPRSARTMSEGMA